jgi:uncharacterized membrane protein
MEQEETSVVRDESLGQVRQEKRITTASETAPGTAAADTEVVSKLSPGRRAVEFVYLVFGVFVVMLLLRMLLKLLAANPDAPFTGFVYGFTNVLLVPFRGLLANWASGHSVFEPSVAIAIIIYALVGWMLARLLAITLSRSVTTATRRSNRSRPWVD